MCPSIAFDSCLSMLHTILDYAGKFYEFLSKHLLIAFMTISLCSWIPWVAVMIAEDGVHVGLF